MRQTVSGLGQYLGTFPALYAGSVITIHTIIDGIVNMVNLGAAKTMSGAVTTVLVVVSIFFIAIGALLAMWTSLKLYDIGSLASTRQLLAAHTMATLSAIIGFVFVTIVIVVISTTSGVKVLNMSGSNCNASKIFKASMIMAIIFVGFCALLLGVSLGYAAVSGKITSSVIWASSVGIAADVIAVVLAIVSVVMLKKAKKKYTVEEE